MKQDHFLYSVNWLQQRGEMECTVHVGLTTLSASDLFLEFPTRIMKNDLSVISSLRTVLVKWV
jgi:hypothetical protein